MRFLCVLDCLKIVSKKRRHVLYIYPRLPKQKLRQYFFLFSQPLWLFILLLVELLFSVFVLCNHDTIVVVAAVAIDVFL